MECQKTDELSARGCGALLDYIDKFRVGHLRVHEGVALSQENKTRLSLSYSLLRHVHNLIRQWNNSIGSNSSTTLWTVYTTRYP